MFKVILLSMLAAPVYGADCVVLLHGLARTAQSMSTMAEALSSAGLEVINVDYPSRKHPIQALAPMAVNEGVAGCAARRATRVHFVTHSMGGILVRYYLSKTPLPELGRVVMIAPPNQGSEVVDALVDIPGFLFANGPAGAQLGTDKNSIPLRLGPVNYEVGVIAGSTTFNPILSQFLPNPDDGKVSVRRTKVAGMTDFRVVEVSHPFIMNDELVIRHTLAFLREGQFLGLDE